MENIKTLLQAMRKCRDAGIDLELTFTPEDAKALLAELYDVLAAPAVMEYNAKHGQDKCCTSSH